MLHLKLAIRNIGRQKRRSFLTGLSMTFGFFMAALSLGIIDGTFGSLIDSFTLARTGHVQIHDADYLEKPSLYKQVRQVQDVIETVKTVPGVVAAAPRIFAPSLSFASEKTSPAFVIGIDPDQEAAATTLEDVTRLGPYLPGALSDDGYDQTMVGAGIAQALKLDVGDELVLIGQGVDGSIANDIYRVSSVIGTPKGQERLNVYMSLDAARRYLSMSGDAAHEVAVIANDRRNAQAMAVSISQALDDNTLAVDPWQKVEEMFYNLVVSKQQSNKVMMFVVMAMVAIGVLNAVLVSVMERTREFGLMRAVGTRPANVFSMILVETMVLAVLACLLGLVLSLPMLDYLVVEGIPIPPVEMGPVVYDHMYAEISTSVLVIPAILVLSTAFLVALWPAARSARITPVAALGAA